jgi:hypothetical protein
VDRRLRATGDERGHGHHEAAVIHGKEATLEAGDLARRDSRPPPDSGRGRENREVAGIHGTEPTLEAVSGRGREVQWAGGYTFHWRGRDGRQTLTQTVHSIE